MKIASLWFAGFLLLGIQSNVFAYPEMARSGYVNCATCHVSLSGGGLLNDYGRSIAREKMAIFKSKDEKSTEQDFAYGILDNTEIQKYLKAGGDFRSVYYYVNNSKIRKAETIFMQGDLQAAYVGKKVTVNAAAGVMQPGYAKDLEFISRTHYAQYSFTDEINLRAGKFFPAYGIKTADHVTLTRDSLSFGDNFESYNLEGSYISENWNFFVTGNFGRFDDEKDLQDKGGIVQASYAPTEKLKFGGNVWYGATPTQRRWVTGPFAVLGLTQSIYLQSEIDFQFLSPNSGTSTHGYASTQKLSYEALDGLWVFGTQEYGKISSDVDATQKEVYGLGVQFFPRSHFEFNVSYEKRRTGGSVNDFTDYAWLVTHFYL